ncbi:MAG: M48 family metalloprotease [Fimbriimonadaceae bacterium]|nr:M48 family metalloprotease [Fimbriimonadaceae bacterium]
MNTVDATEVERAGIESRQAYSASLEMINRAQREADADYGKFIGRTRRLIFGGMAYAFVWFIVFLAIFIALILLPSNGGRLYVWGILVAGALIVATVSALFVKREKDEGTLITRDEAPALWTDVDRLTQLAKVPPIARIRVVMDLNAAAATRIIPWRFWNPVEQELIIGWSLLSLLDAEECRSVLAHEFGHFGGRHGDFSLIALRVAAYLENVAIKTQNVFGGQIIYKQFFLWFMPRLSARMFVISRHNEYEADAFEAKFSGADVAARSLVRLSGQSAKMYHPVTGILWDWPRDARELPQDMATRARKFWQNVRLLPVSESRLRRLLRVETKPMDTHPELSDRLRNMKANRDVHHLLNLQKVHQRSAVEHYFGPKIPDVEARLSKAFLDEHNEAYVKSHLGRAMDHARLGELLDSAKTRPLNATELEQTADLLRTFGREAEAKEVYRKWRALEPDSPYPKAYLGDLLMRDPDSPEYAEGLGLVTAAAQHPELASNAYSLLARDADLRGESTLARQYEQRAAESTGRIYSMLTKYVEVSYDDDLHPPTLAADIVNAIRHHLASVPMVGEAYLLTKRDPAGVHKDIQVLLVFPARTLGLVTVQTEQIYERLQSVPYAEDFIPQVSVTRKRWRQKLVTARALKIK